MKFKHPRKRSLLLAMLGTLCLVIVTVQYLNFTGFCYDEMKYLSNEELIDKFLFKEQADKLTFDEKVEIMKKRTNVDYPYAFRVSGEPWFTSKGTRIVNKIFGYYLYEISGYSREYSTAYAVTACGRRVESIPEDFTPAQYEQIIEERKNKIMEKGER